MNWFICLLYTITCTGCCAVTIVDGKWSILVLLRILRSDVPIEKQPEQNSESFFFVELIIGTKKQEKLLYL
jgi:hypothetical protein